MNKRTLLAAAFLCGVAATVGAGALLMRPAPEAAPPAARGGGPAAEPESVPAMGRARGPWGKEYRPPVPESRLEGRREEVLEAARRIRIDGDLRDWDDIPAAYSAEVLGPGAGDRRIVAVALAPTAAWMRVMVKTAGWKRTAGARIWIPVDRTGERGFEAAVEIDGAGAVSLWESPAAAKEDGKRKRRIEADMKGGTEGFEVSIPLAAFTAPAAPAGAPAPAARRWVRIRTSLIDHEGRTLERGPAIASFVLDQPCLQVPAAVGGGDEAPCSIAPPVIGRWFVSQGPFSSFSHEGEWAYDLGMDDATHETTRIPGSTRAEDAYCWGQPVVVRDLSRVLEAKDGAMDHETFGRLEDRAGPANHLEVRLSSGWILSLFHLRRESVIVAKGDSVRAFTKVGSVGNSGMSTGPHLHLAANRKSTAGHGAPIRFEDVTVGLNAFDGDAWATFRESWAVEEGFFFSRVGR